MADPIAPAQPEAGNLALAFVNTLRVRGTALEDTVASPAALRSWLAEAGLLAAEAAAALVASPPEARILLDEARRLRDALGEGVAAFSRGQPLPPSLLPALNRCLEHRRTHHRAVAGEGGIHMVACPTWAHASALLAPIAEAAVELFGGADPARVRQCHADDCVRWFVDGSKNGRRKWCSMARCGNRAKVAAHYRRTRPS